MIKSYNFLFFFSLFFLIYKIVAIYLTNFDLFGDEAQYWLWSKDLDYGYYSKPPLLAWTIAVFSFFLGSDFFALKMIPVFLYCPVVLVVFIITKKLYEDRFFAFIVSITFFLAPAVSLSSFLISTDILLLFFWSLSLMMVLFIKDSPKIINFTLLGIFLGLAFMAKYAAIYFIISLILLCFEKSMRSVFLKNKISFIYCFFVILIIIAPNLVWNYNNGWLTFVHTQDNASLHKVGLNIWGGLEFVISQILMIGPIVVVGYFFTLSKNFKLDFNTKFLLIFSLPVFLIILIESLLVRANANWAAVGLVSFLILFVRGLYLVNSKILFFNNIFNIFVGFVLFGLIGLSSSYKPFERINGISSFANEIYIKVKQHENLVISDRMLFSSLGYIYRNKNINLYMPISPESQITNHFQITNPLLPTHNKNFIFIGYEDQLNYLLSNFKIKVVGEKNVPFKKDLIKIYEVVF